MNELQINNQSIEIKELKGQRVITFKDIDTVHGRTSGTAKRNFYKNKIFMIEGEDYIVRNSYQARNEFGINAPNGLILITESGYLMIAKSLTDDLAWQVQRELVKNYFKAKEQLPEVPVAPMSMEDIMIYSLQEMKNVKLQLETQEKAIEQTNSKIKGIQDAVVVDTQNWRKWINESIKKLAQSEIIIEEFGDLRYQKVRVNTYKELESRAGCDLKVRLKNLKERLEKAGAKKNTIKDTGNLDVIEQDKKLKEIYTAIIKDMLVKYQSVA